MDMNEELRNSAKIGKNTIIWLGNHAGTGAGKYVEVKREPIPAPDYSQECKVDRNAVPPSWVIDIKNGISLN